MNMLEALVRKIHKQDKDDILEISRHIWGGHDYLPKVIDEWLRSRNCHTFGVEVGGRVVAVGNLRLVDQRRTGWMEGLRVHPDYRKRGLADQLTQHFVDLAPSLGVERLRYTTGLNNRASLKLAKQYGFERKLRMTVFWYAKVKSARGLSQGTLPTEEATPKEAYALSKTNSSVIPYDLLIYDWKAVEATLKGFKEVGKTHGFRTSRKGGKLDSLSFGAIRKDGKQNRISATIYTKDFESLQAHLASQVGAAGRKRVDSLVATVTTEFEKPLKDLKWEAEFDWKMRLVLLEKSVKPQIR